MNSLSPINNPTIRVLIVEAPVKDEEALKKYLSEETDPVYNVETIHNQKTGLERAALGGIDVAFLDEAVLEREGFGVLDPWAQKAPQACLVILFNKDNKELFSEAIRKGAQDYVTKTEINGRLLSRVIRYAMERKGTQEKMKHLANQGLDFMSLVSHELRPPLAITKEGVHLVWDKVLGKTNQKQQQVLTTALRNINRLDQVIMNMLDISKIEAGKIALNKQRVNLADLAKQIVDSFDTRIREKKLTLRVVSSSDQVDIYADKDRIFQVLTNLVGNAVKFTKAGSIGITITQGSDEVECAVSDTGTGITKDDLPRVFGKFQQLAWAPGGGEKGVGLGLAISKAIVELHGGQLQAESELGKGSRFTFMLPKELPTRARGKKGFDE